MKFTQGYIIFLLLIFSSLCVNAQSDTDSVVLKKYPVVIGNIGFATDSVEIVVGKVPRGEITTFNFEVYNFGNEPVVFAVGKSNKFIGVNFQPTVLSPRMVGTMTAEFDADMEMDLGDFDVEIAITSDDKLNPYKFLTLLMEIIEGTGGVDSRKYDSVPHIVFDHYNHDFGHHKRGKIIYHTFILTNEGGEPLNIIDVQTPKGITIIDLPTEVILPGEKTILRFKINTRGKVGIQHQTIKVKSTDPEYPLVILGIHGSVRVFPNNKKPSNQCGNDGERF